MPVNVSLEPDRGRAPFSPLSRVSLHDFFSLLCLAQLVLLTPSVPTSAKIRVVVSQFWERTWARSKKDSLLSP
jgi:hypothetical protein